jgi:hypothetical protein
MQFKDFSFGSIGIDGITHEYDVVIDRREVRKRKKNRPSNSGTSLGTIPYPSKRTYRGNAAA